MADEKQVSDFSEKQNAVASELEHSGTASPIIVEYDDLPDPDAGKSDEERAKLVRHRHPPSPQTPTDRLFLGQSPRLEDRSLADPLAVAVVPALFLGPHQHRQCSCRSHGKGYPHGGPRL